MQNSAHFLPFCASAHLLSRIFSAKNLCNQELFCIFVTEKVSVCLKYLLSTPPEYLLPTNAVSTPYQRRIKSVPIGAKKRRVRHRVDMGVISLFILSLLGRRGLHDAADSRHAISQTVRGVASGHCCHDVGHTSAEMLLLVMRHEDV